MKRITLTICQDHYVFVDEWDAAFTFARWASIVLAHDPVGPATRRVRKAGAYAKLSMDCLNVAMTRLVL